MELIGKVVLYIIMICCLLGAVASIVKPESELGKSFHEGIGVMTALFIPIIGTMISVPFIIIGVEKIFAPMFATIGADPAMASSMFVSADFGGYALALKIAATPEIAMMCLCVAIMAAPILTFNIPVGLSIMKKEDHPYFVLGAMSGILAIPFAVFISCFVMFLTKPMIRENFSTSGEALYQLQMDMGSVLVNLIPLVILCVVLAVGLKLFPKIMVKIFLIFGKALMAILSLITAAAIIEYYTGLFSSTVGWGFDPIFGDDENHFRSVEMLGSIAMMLSGAFPMVYLIRKFFGKGLARLGGKVGLDGAGSAGLVAGMANAVALFGMVKDMNAQSKVITIAFVVTAGYCIGDFLAFNMNFQPNLVIPVFIGQFCGGIIGILFARLIAVPSIHKIK